ncbi:MAG: SurA N-terminal domain-containing protein [Desulfobacterales bacterium]
MKIQQQFGKFFVNAVSGALILFSILVLSYRCNDVQAEIVDRIVAQVNEDIVTLQEVNQAMKPHIEKIQNMGYAPDDNRKMIYEIREKVISELINDKLTDQAVEKSQITLHENEINSALERVKEMNFLTDEDLKQALAQEGMTVERYRENLRLQLLRTKLMNREVRSKIVITDADIRSYYEAHSDEYAGKKAFRLRTIVKRIPVLADEERISGLKHEMASIVKQLDEGVPFEELARKHSDLLADEGGDLGVFEPDSLSPEIRAAVAGLSEGEHSQVVNTKQGLQIFYVQELTNTPGQSLESLTDDIKEKLYEQAMEKKFSEWVEGLRADAHIKIIK